MSERLSRLVGPGHVARLQALGHQFLETSRLAHGSANTADSKGNHYLDAISSEGIFNLGRHCLEVKQELRAALHETDQGNFPMISVEKARLAEALADFTGHGLNCSLFGVTRGETLDAACKVARGVTGRTRLVSLEGAWHGETGFAMALSTRLDRGLYGPLIPDSVQISVDDAAQAESAITQQTAAVVVEPVQAENGCRIPSLEYLKRIEALCKKRGALFVVDETQTGLGRTGSRFAFSRLGLQPDMLLVGEALGAGLFPIAATLMTDQVNEFLNRHPMIHLSTFGGSDLGCRVGLAALERYLALRPWDNAWRIGRWLKGELQRLAREHGSFRAVSGEGMLLAVQLETETDAIAFCKGLAQNGVLALPGRVNRSSVILRPSLLLTAKEAAVLVETIGKALTLQPATPLPAVRG